MQNQNHKTFTLRIAQDTVAESRPSNTPTLRLADSVSDAPTIDLAAAYRNSRMAAHVSAASMRSCSSSFRGSYFRRAA